jgi:type VI secretion system protein ImpK
MRDDAARFVYPVLETGLTVRDRLAEGTPLVFDREHARLRDLLLSPAAEDGVIGPRPAGRATPAGFLGARYALACWLDELFTQGTAWRDVWNERKLEIELYGTNDRAWKFWDQARQAEQRPASDALEVFFLCAQLGFRGTMADDPAKLRQWAEAARQRVGELPVEPTPYDLEPDPIFDAPPRHGFRRFENMILVAGATALILIPAVSYLIVSRAGWR